jgi:hypothetical protein
VSLFCKQEQELNEDFISTFGVALVQAIQQRIFKPEYNLLQMSDHLQSMVEMVQSNNSKKITLPHIIKALEDTFNTCPRGIFYKLMMHSGMSLFLLYLLYIRMDSSKTQRKNKQNH